MEKELKLIYDIILECTPSESLPQQKKEYWGAAHRIQGQYPLYSY